MAYYQEDQKSRKLSTQIDASDGKASASADYSYVAVDYASEDDCMTAVLNGEPTSIVVAGLLCIRTQCDVKPELADPDKSIFRVSIKYQTPNLGGGGGGGGGADTDPETDPESPDDPSKRSFDFGTRGTMQLYAVDGQDSYKVKKDGAVEQWQKFGRSINRDSDDVAPEGVEINGDACTFSITKVMKSSIASNSWFKSRLDQVWTLNDATFFGFPARTVALTGISGEFQNSGDFQITYKFEYRKDQSTAPGNTLLVETRPGRWEPLSYATPVSGWDYVWYRYRTREEKQPDEPTQAATVVRYLSSVHVAGVYLDSDFDLLGDLS